jgi:hypothetical protein
MGKDLMKKASTTMVDNKWSISHGLDLCVKVVNAVGTSWQPLGSVGPKIIATEKGTLKNDSDVPLLCVPIIDDQGKYWLRTKLFVPRDEWGKTFVAKLAGKRTVKFFCCKLCFLFLVVSLCVL